MEGERQLNIQGEVQNHNDFLDSEVVNPGRRRFIKMGIFATLGFVGAMIPGCGCNSNEPPSRLRDLPKKIPNIVPPGTN